MKKIITVLLLCLLSSHVYSATYKCKQHGKTVYQATKCPGDSVAGEVKTSAPSDANSSEAVSLNFRDVPVSNALNVLADFSGNKFVIDPSITASGAFFYRKTPWKVVVKSIENRFNLKVTLKNGTMYVSRR